jgi:2'-5' RNA ligase
MLRGVDSIRAFVALSLGSRALGELSRARKALEAEAWADKVRWVPDENLHLTLQFLGDLASDRVPAIAAAVRDAAAGAPEIVCCLTAVSAFPSASRVRVIVAELSEAPGLESLSRRLGEALAPLGFEPEKRPFRPHITLGRVRRPPLRGIRVAAPLAPVPLEAHELVLFRSELHKTGAVHRRLSGAPLD